MQPLAALLLALGPHAAESVTHAHDAPAAWVSAPAHAVRASDPSAPLPKRVYGYLPYWQSIDLASFRWDLVTDVIAFSVDVGTSGSIANPRMLPGAALLSAAHAHGVRVHLCATLFNGATGSEIPAFLGSPAARANAATELAALTPDGLNLDFEFVTGASRDAFTAFVQQVRAALPPTAELTLAMPSTTAYSGYDVPALAAVADRLLLMEYQYHWPGSGAAGAVAPLDVVQKAVDGYLSRAPAASFAMGVPYYGYEWPTTSIAMGSDASGTGTTVLFDSVFAKFAGYGRRWDGGSQTPWYTFSEAGRAGQGWVDDGESLSLKYRFARARDLAGVMIWALGYDGGRSEAWNALQTGYFPEVPYQPPPSRGCSQAGASAPLLSLAALLLFARRKGPYPGGAC